LLVSEHHYWIPSRFRRPRSLCPDVTEELAISVNKDVLNIPSDVTKEKCAAGWASPLLLDCPRPVVRRSFLSSCPDRSDCWVHQRTHAGWRLVRHDRRRAAGQASPSWRDRRLSLGPSFPSTGRAADDCPFRQERCGGWRPAHRCKTRAAAVQR